MIITTYLPPLDEDKWRRWQEHKQEIAELRKIFKNIEVHFPDGSLFTIVPPLMEILDILDEVVKKNEPFIQDTQREQYYETVVPQLEEARKGLLTFDRVIALIGLLLSIYSAVISTLPDDATNRLIEQNEEQIKLMRTQAELLQEISDSLKDRGCECSIFLDDADSLAHGTDEDDDLPIPPCEDSDNEDLNQETDSQN